MTKRIGAKGTDGQKQRGFALISVLLLVFVLASIGSLVLRRSQTRNLETRLAHAQSAALYAAEGGLALARHSLAQSPDWKGARIEIGGCAVEVRVTRLGDAEWRIESLSRSAARPHSSLGASRRLLLHKQGERETYLKPDSD